MSSEATTQRQIWLNVGRTSTLFRLNTGRAWVSGAGPAKRLTSGDVLVPAGRPISIGFSAPSGDPIVGASDLIGFTSIEVTPAMVGKRLAVFTAIETKRSSGGKTSEQQANFVQQVDNAGGIAGIANSPEAAKEIIANWRQRF